MIGQQNCLRESRSQSQISTSKPPRNSLSPPRDLKQWSTVFQSWETQSVKSNEKLKSYNSTFGILLPQKHQLPDKMFHCAYCEAIFSSATLKQQHENRHFRLYRCKVCHTGYSNRYELFMHTKRERHYIPQSSGQPIPRNFHVPRKDMPGYASKPPANFRLLPTRTQHRRPEMGAVEYNQPPALRSILIETGKPRISKWEASPYQPTKEPHHPARASSPRPSTSGLQRRESGEKKQKSQSGEKKQKSQKKKKSTKKTDDKVKGKSKRRKHHSKLDKDQESAQATSRRASFPTAPTAPPPAPNPAELRTELDSEEERQLLASDDE